MSDLTLALPYLRVVVETLRLAHGWFDHDFQELVRVAPILFLFSRLTQNLSAGD